MSFIDRILFASWQILQREIEGRSSELTAVGRRCSARNRRIGRALENRYHRLLLRILEWTFHLETLSKKPAVSIAAISVSLILLCLVKVPRPPSFKSPYVLRRLCGRNFLSIITEFRLQTLVRVVTYTCYIHVWQLINIRVGNDRVMPCLWVLSRFLTDKCRFILLQWNWPEYQLTRRPGSRRTLDR